MVNSVLAVPVEVEGLSSTNRLLPQMMIAMLVPDNQDLRLHRVCKRKPPDKQYQQKAK